MKQTQKNKKVTRDSVQLDYKKVEDKIDLSFSNSCSVLEMTINVNVLTCYQQLHACLSRHFLSWVAGDEVEDVGSSVGLFQVIDP